jgi:hypothetical protein
MHREIKITLPSTSTDALVRDLEMTLGAGKPALMYQGAERLGFDILLVVAGGVLVVSIKQALVHRREPMVSPRSLSLVIRLLCQRNRTPRVDLQVKPPDQLASTPNEASESATVRLSIGQQPRR